MAGTVKSRLSHRAAASQRGMEEPPFVKWCLILLAVGFAALFLLLPLVNVFAQAFSRGWSYYWAALSDPDSLEAIRLTLLIATISVPLNVIFGLAAAWSIARFDFRGKTLLTTFIDLPFAVSPVVSGLMFLLLFGAKGLLGPWLLEHDLAVVYAVPGMVLATVFVTFPFVARELIPVMQSLGSDQEQAAMTLGAGPLRMFWHVTLPSVKWGLLYGVILCNARAMGEFGAVSVVSGHIAGLTDTMPLRVDKLYQEYNGAAAFAVASLLAALALLTLVAKSLLEWHAHRRQSDAERNSAAAAEQLGDTQFYRKSA